jgi:hypothetical protein
MSGSREAVQLRAEISRYREQTRAGKYPSELRERAEAYAQQRVRAGATPAEIAAELGVRKSTADRWASGDERSAETLLSAAPAVARSFPFVPVVVRPEHREMPSMRLRLAFPDGTRLQVSGIAGHDLAEAIDALRRTR